MDRVLEPPCAVQDWCNDLLLNLELAPRKILKSLGLSFAVIQKCTTYDKTPAMGELKKSLISGNTDSLGDCARFAPFPEGRITFGKRKKTTGNCRKLQIGLCACRKVHPRKRSPVCVCKSFVRCAKRLMGENARFKYGHPDVETCFKNASVSGPKLLQKNSLQRKCFGAINFVIITKESLYKANSLAYFL